MDVNERLYLIPIKLPKDYRQKVGAIISGTLLNEYDDERSTEQDN